MKPALLDILQLPFCLGYLTLLHRRLKIEYIIKGFKMSTKGYIEIDQELCKGCEICIHFCPKHAISQSSKVNAGGYSPASFSKNDECTGCAICALVCPEVAIEVYRG